MEIITATIQLDLASDYLGLQENFRFFTEDCHSLYMSLWFSVKQLYPHSCPFGEQLKVVNDLEAGGRIRYFFCSSCRGVGMLVKLKFFIEELLCKVL